MNDCRISVIGSGLIGSSIAQAVKRRTPSCHVTCLDLEGKLEAVTQLEFADHVSTLERGVAQLKASRLVVVATPTGVIIPTLREISVALSDGTTVTDVGSTKAEIMAHARDHLPQNVHFVGGHPLAGSEQSGATACDPLLFDGKPYVLCPYPDTPPDVMVRLIDFVEGLGARPITLEAEEHDRMLAMVSHMPHLVAIALMRAAVEQDHQHELLEQLVGPCFLDMTRVAASNPGMWQGIIDTNRAPVTDALNRFLAQLNEVQDAMQRGDLAELWAHAGRARRGMTPETMPRDRKPDLRTLIDRCDAQLLKILARRLHIVKRIGRVKRHRDDPVGDPRRETQMRDQRLAWAHKLSLPTELVDDFFDLIVSHSRRIQE